MSAAEVVQEVSLVPASGGLPEPVQRRGITEPQWRTLFNLFPGARPESALMVWDYCRSRQLDPMKKPCHIVPMRVKVNGEWQWKDVVMPGIYEYRITAQRTGLYLGHTEPVYGPELEHLGVKAPSWCAMTVHRWNEKAQREVPYPVKVWFAEVVATREDRQTKAEVVNERWTKAPIQMLTKCTEAAALREAFPEEFGGEPTAEEMAGQRTIDVDDEPRPTVSAPKPALRKSEHGTTPIPAAATTEAPAAALEADDEPTAKQQTSPSTSPTVGLVTTIAKRDTGAAFITLDTGYVCGTKNPAFVAAAEQAKAGGYRVELSCRQPKDPKFAPTLEEIAKVEREVGEEG